MKNTHLMGFNSIPASYSARAPHADITNAPQLFGDPSDSDFEDGDPDLYGDLYGDVDPMAAYMIGSGDVKGWARKNKNLLLGGGAALAGAGATAALLRARQNKIKKQESLRNQVAIRSSLGKIDKKKPFSFFGLHGAKMNSAPIDPQSKFAADTFKVMLDRQSLDTPFLQETAIGSFSTGVWTATATGVVNARFAHTLFLQFGTNTLNASPGTVISISLSIPLFDGTTLSIASTPFLFTYEAGFDVRFSLTPYVLVANKPIPVMAYYSNARPIVATVTGLPSASSVNLVVPGSLHPWTIAMRNAIL